MNHAPTGFQNTVERFVTLYLGTKQSPVPFGGRVREMAALNAWLDGVAGADGTIGGAAGSNNLLITAPPGQAKTAASHPLDRTAHGRT